MRTGGLAAVPVQSIDGDDVDDDIAYTERLLVSLYTFDHRASNELRSIAITEELRELAADVDDYIHRARMTAAALLSVLHNQKRK